MYVRTKEQNIAASRRYRLKHPERVKATKKANRAKHREKISAYNAAYHVTYYAAHAEKIRTRVREWSLTHPEKTKARLVAWVKANPERVKVHTGRKRARKANAPINDFTVAQWETMLKHYGYRCVYCGKKDEHLTQDHIQPLSKGGSHTLSNIVPACRSCNSRKHAGPVLTPIQPLLLA